MTTMVAFPDVHDRSDAFKTVRHVLADVDVILLPGDMTNGSADHLHQLFDIIEPYNESILAVCGNMDTEGMNMWLAREGISLHRRHLMLDGIAFLGVGGALPFAGDYVFSEAQFAQFLDEAWRGVPAGAPTILVCHQPPYGTQVDLAHGQHVGSHAVRAFIERVQPLICFSGHIHDAVGIDRLGETYLVNPGPAQRTQQYAFAEVENGAVQTLELRPVEALEV